MVGQKRTVNLNVAINRLLILNTNNQFEQNVIISKELNDTVKHFLFLVLVEFAKFLLISLILIEHLNRTHSGPFMPTIPQI